MWDIVIEKRAEKTLASLPKKLRERIMNAIDRLAYGPYQSDLDIKQLAGRPEWRLRVGGWRVLFRVYKDEIIIIVVSVSPHGDVYK